MRINFKKFSSPQALHRLKKRARKFDNIQYLYFLSGLVFLFSFGLLIWFGRDYFLSQSRSIGIAPLASQVATKTAPPCVARRVLDGVCVADPSNISPPLVGVMIENAADSWPLAGLSAASVVYEAPVEGDIPRFLAIYPLSAAVAKVGSVRSARPYYLDWVREYGRPLYLHVGGSPDALAALGQYDHIIDVNEFFHGNFFWRATERLAPHNAYTSSERWTGAWQKYGAKESIAITPWQFAKRDACQTDCVSQVTVSFLSPTYDALWRYNATSTQYERYQRGGQQADDDGTPIVADTVIVARMDMAVLDEVGRKDVTTVGSGQAMIFRDGYRIVGTWRKKSHSARTEWLDSASQPIPLKAGKIWIEIVAPGMEVTWQ